MGRRGKNLNLFFFPSLHCPLSWAHSVFRKGIPHAPRHNLPFPVEEPFWNPPCFYRSRKEGPLFVTGGRSRGPASAQRELSASESQPGARETKGKVEEWKTTDKVWFMDHDFASFFFSPFFFVRWVGFVEGLDPLMVGKKKNFFLSFFSFLFDMCECCLKANVERRILLKWKAGGWWGGWKKSRILLMMSHDSAFITYWIKSHKITVPQILQR